MLNYFFRLFLSISLFQFAAYADISSSHLKQNYSLVLMATDQEGNECVAVIPMHEFMQDDIVCLLPGRFVYNRAAWDTICSYWEPPLVAENVGCYNVTIESIVDGEHVSMFKINFGIPLETEKGTNILTVPMFIDPTLNCTAGIAVQNMFLNDASINSSEYIKRAVVPESAVSSLDSLIDKIDDDDLPEEMYRRPAPSQLEVYARKIGIKMLLSYIAVKQFFGDCWNRVKTAVGE